MKMLDSLGERNLTPMDLVTMQDPLRSVLTQAVRSKQIRTDEMAKELGLSLKSARRLANELVKKGLFKYVDGKVFHVRLSGTTHTSPSKDNIWEKFDDPETS